VVSGAAVPLVLGVLLLPAVVRAADASKGQATYELRCAPCHGSEGRGDGPVASGLTPPPRNFHDAEFWKDRTPENLRGTVKQGRPGTLMAGFAGVLTDQEIDDVIAYVQSFRPAER
jgi:mono/diheme cytochrome c family protein